jgi:hypothetical protein
MNNTPLKRFMEEVMAISSGFSRMGNASVGIVGASGADDQVVNDLRKNVLAFAAEYSKSQPNHEKLATLSQAIEGSLQTVKLLHGLSDKKLEEMIGDLQSLLDTPKG